MRGKKLLFIGAGVEQVAGILKARQMGLQVFAMDANPRARGARFAHRFFNVSTYDIEAAAELARWIRARFGLDGVATIGIDAPRTLAAISEQLGLAGPSWETAIACSDKLLQKRILKRWGLPVPDFEKVSSPGEVRKMLDRFGAVILKPADSRGSRGVVQVYKDDDIETLLDIARSNSPSGTVIAERMIRGDQISTESLIIDGIAYTVGFSDRNYEYWDRFKPHIIENGGDMPSKHIALYPMINKLVQEAAKALGIRNGILKGDLVVENNEPIIIEFAARPSGGFFCTHQIPYSWGHDFPELILMMYLGERPKLEKIDPTRFRGSSIRFVHPLPGLITDIRGITEAYKTGARCVKILKRVGEEVPRPENSNAAAAVVISAAEKPHLSRAIAERAAKALVFTTVPIEEARHESLGYSSAS